MEKIKKKLTFLERLEDNLKKSQMGYDANKYMGMSIVFSLIIAGTMAGFTFALALKNNSGIGNAIIIFIVFFAISFFMILQIPSFGIKNKKALLESDLLYSARHLVLKLEAGSSLINSFESVSKLKTNSSVYFKELMYDISLGATVEDAIRKAIEYSPSKAYIKILEEIKSSLRTGSDIQKTLRSTLDDITKQHLIQIEEYGKKLNPMSMFYMIIGTILPSLGTSMLVVASSLGLLGIILYKWMFIAMALVVFAMQIFFILAFKSLKPAVIG
ncbi:type II secretion system F family protein [Candidatus Woesearchaeota archaeon]|nr:type II secretion system F family protein [Candidatus Woesearchaeota archaeon]